MHWGATQTGREKEGQTDRQKQRGMEGKTERQAEQLVINKNRSHHCSSLCRSPFCGGIEGCDIGPPSPSPSGKWIPHLIVLL